MINPATSTSSLASPRRAWLAAGLLALAALIAYGGAFRVPFLLDDEESVTDNATLRQLWPPWSALSPPAGGGTVSGRPVLNYSLAVNRAIGGESVAGYHAVNLTIHWLAACVLFGLVARTLARPRLRGRFGPARFPLALAAAAVWLLHPLQTESVTYICQRAESLGGLLALLTLYGFVRSIDASGRRAALAWASGSWMSCLLGMATKEIVAAVPLLVLAYDVVFVGEGTLRAAFVSAWRARWGYYLALAATWFLLAMLIIGTHGRGGTAGFSSGLSPWLYLLTQCRALVVYLELVFWPHPLVFDYGLGVVQRVADVWPQAVLLLVLLTCSGVALARRSPLGFLGLWFFAILAPSSSFVPIGTEPMAEHRLYLPLAAVVAFVVTGLYAVAGRRSLFLWPAVAAALAILTVQRNAVYRTDLDLWRDTVARAPHNGRALYNLGIVLSQRGDHAGAVAAGETALRLDDGWDFPRRAPLIENKLGYDLAMLGRLPEAVHHYEAALHWNPGYAHAHLNLARALVQLDRYPDAIPHFAAAVRLDPANASAESALGDALLHENRPVDAIVHYQAAVRLAPAGFEPYQNIGYALILAGRAPEAIAPCAAACRLAPRTAAPRVSLAFALIQSGRPADAIAPCEEAVRLQPDLVAAHHMLGLALDCSGRFADAIAAYAEALRLDPSDAATRHDLATARAHAGVSR